MPTYGLDRSMYNYISDDGNTYTISMSMDNAAAQSATPATSFGVTPPKGYKLRHVYGVDASGNRTRLPILDKANTMWLGSVNNFTKKGVAFAIEGRKGENRINRS